jgi:hypothetical protein
MRYVVRAAHAAALFSRTALVDREHVGTREMNDVAFHEFARRRP